MGTEKLEGKTVIITGANRGIGKEVARDFSKRGDSMKMQSTELFYSKLLVVLLMVI